MPRREQTPPQEERFDDFRRVTWSPGDPERVRAGWSRDARALARSAKRPAVVALVAALEPHMHATDGYAWISNEALRDNLGANYVSSVERSLTEAARLGVIERETRTLSNSDGKVLGRKRRIYPTRHRGLDDIAKQIRTRQEARELVRRSHSGTHRTPNPEFTKDTSCNINGLRDIGGRGATEPLIGDYRTLNRTPTGSGNNQDSVSSSKEERHTAPPQLWKGRESGFGPEAFSSHLRPVIDAFAFIGPECSRDPTGEFGAVLAAGRHCWRTLRDHRTTPTDADALLAHARDAVRRSWTDHDPKIAAMLGHLEAARASIVASPAGTQGRLSGKNG